ncbi:MAG: hypothetical protein GY943_29955 [Chloroflexi bacterium]|nr:hypothetical protein [Chloroflexota bacterium]
MSENGTSNSKATRLGLTATFLTIAIIVAYLLLLSELSGRQFLWMSGLAAFFAFVSVGLSRKAMQLSEPRRMWLWINVAVSIGFLMVLGILLLNTAVYTIR